MKRIILITLVSLSLLAAFAFAETSLKSEVDKTRITTDETITYKVIITSSEKTLPQAQIPKFEGFEAVSQAESSTVSFKGGSIKNILVYAFILAPKETGKFKIEAATIKIKNDTYSSDTFEIEVTQGKAKPKPKPKEQPFQPEENQPEESEPGPKESKVTL
jgi:hypothetical protein